MLLSSGAEVGLTWIADLRHNYSFDGYTRRSDATHTSALDTDRGVICYHRGMATVFLPSRRDINQS